MLRRLDIISFTRCKTKFRPQEDQIETVERSLVEENMPMTEIQKYWNRGVNQQVQLVDANVNFKCLEVVYEVIGSIKETQL